MSYFAEINSNNTVSQIIVMNDTTPNPEQWLLENLGGKWIKTSNTIRFNFAGIGFTYDEVRDAFIAPEPEGNLGFDEKTCTWIMPEWIPPKAQDEA
jgi:hypothetical protein